MLAIIDNQRGASRVKNILLLSLSLSHNNWQFEFIFSTSTLYLEIYILQTTKKEKHLTKKKEYSQLKLKSECIFYWWWKHMRFNPKSKFHSVLLENFRYQGKDKIEKKIKELFWCYAWLCVLILIFNHKL